MASEAASGAETIVEADVRVRADLRLGRSAIASELPEMSHATEDMVTAIRGWA
jgi:hypothetical protein